MYAELIDRKADFLLPLTFDKPQADVFWQNAGFNLQHERFECDMDDGTYSLVSHDSPNEELSSDDNMPNVSIVTGLVAVRLAGNMGTRLFFHDERAYLHQLEYMNNEKWKYVGVVSPDNHVQGPAVGVGVVNASAQMWAVEARSYSNLEIAGTFLGDPWSLCEFSTLRPHQFLTFSLTTPTATVPRPLSNSDTTSTSTQNFIVNTTQAILVGLEAWPTQVANLGMAVDRDESKYIFYIGSNKALYYVTSEVGKNLGMWSTYYSLDTKYWPLADDEAADFAVASDPASYEIRLYYVSGGSMVEVSRIGKDNWANAAALPTRVTTVSKTPLNSNIVLLPHQSGRSLRRAQQIQHKQGRVVTQHHRLLNQPTYSHPRPYPPQNLPMRHPETHQPPPSPAAPRYRLRRTEASPPPKRRVSVSCRCGRTACLWNWLWFSLCSPTHAAGIDG